MKTRRTVCSGKKNPQQSKERYLRSEPRQEKTKIKPEAVKIESLTRTRHRTKDWRAEKLCAWIAAGGWKKNQAGNRRSGPGAEKRNHASGKPRYPTPAMKNQKTNRCRPGHEGDGKIHLRETEDCFGSQRILMGKGLAGLQNEGNQARKLVRDWTHARENQRGKSTGSHSLRCMKQNLEQSESKKKNEALLNTIGIPRSDGKIEGGHEPMGIKTMSS
jgi:hypothetical protein